MEPRDDWARKLESSLSRVQEVIERTAQRHLEAMEARRKAMEESSKAAGSGFVAGPPGKPPPLPAPFSWLSALEAFEAHGRAAAQRAQENQRERKRRRREEKRLQEISEASKPQGFVFLTAALVLLAFAIVQPGLWWLLFVSFGFGQAGASELGKAYTRDRMLARGEAVPGWEGEERLPAAAGKAVPPPLLSADPVAAAIESRVARIDGLCEKLLGELKAGPDLLKQVVHKPEDTVKGLRATCHELARREKEIRAGLTAEDERRIAREREDLVARIVRERDDVVKMRLGAALKLLDEQIGRRAELSTAASRLEAESTRILYTLENLNTQILRVKTAGAAARDAAGAGIRTSLEQLGEEIDAVADALESVHRDDVERAVSPVVPVGESEGATPDGRLRER